MAFHTGAKKATVKTSPFFYISTIILLGIICYANAFNNQFVWDDKFLVVENSLIRQFNLIRIFSQDILNTYFQKLYYRPIQTLTYAIDGFFWRLEPFGYHLTNIFLHILNALLIFVLIDKLIDNRLIAYLGSLFFVCHPIHTQAVSYISGRADPLFTFFFLASFIAFIRYRKKGHPFYLIASIACFIFSLLSKEAAIIIPFIFLLYGIIYSDEKSNLKKSWVYAPFIAILLIYAFFRTEHLSMMNQSNLVGEGFYARFITLPRTILAYLSLLIAPHQLHMNRSLPLSSSFFELNTFLSALFLAALIFTAFYLRKKMKHISFFIFYFLIAVLPISNIFRLNAVLAEHWLYMPSIAYFFIFAYLVYKFCLRFFKNRFKLTLSIFAISIITTYTMLTIRQNTFWQNDISLYGQILKYEPLNLTARSNLGMAYFRKGQIQKAINEQKKALKISPDDVTAHFFLGYIYYSMDDFDEAEKYFKGALSLCETYDRPHIFLGQIYEARNQPDAAEAEYKKALTANPYSGRAYVNLGLMKYTQNKLDESLRYLEKAITINPNDPRVHSCLGVIYGGKGDYPKAFEYMKKAIRLDPEDSNANINMGNVYNGLGLYDKAILHYRIAISNNPERADAYYNTGNSYYFKGDLRSARNYWKRALEINPTLKEARDSLKKLKKAR